MCLFEFTPRYQKMLAFPKVKCWRIMNSRFCHILHEPIKEPRAHFFRTNRAGTCPFSHGNYGPGLLANENPTKTGILSQNDSELIMILKLTVDSEYLADENIDDNIEGFGKKSLNRTPYSPRITLRENWRDPVLVRPWGPVELASHQPLDIITMVNPY